MLLPFFRFDSALFGVYHVDACSRGGVQLPTGGIPAYAGEPASAFSPKILS